MALMVPRKEAKVMLLLNPDELDLSFSLHFLILMYKSFTLFSFFKS